MSTNPLIAKVRDCASAASDAEVALRAACVEAVAAKVKKVLVAEAAGVTRQTLDRWLASGTNTPKRAPVDVLNSIADGCMILVEHLPANRIGRIMARINTDRVDSAVLTLQEALLAVSPATMSKLTSEDRAVMALATQVSAEAQRIHEAQNRWPKKVYLE